jgi:hypothetical protein
MKVRCENCMRRFHLVELRECCWCGTIWKGVKVRGYDGKTWIAGRPRLAVTRPLTPKTRYEKERKSGKDLLEIIKRDWISWMLECIESGDRAYLACIYFNKMEGSNILHKMHRDITIFTDQMDEDLWSKYYCGSSFKLLAFPDKRVWKNRKLSARDLKSGDEMNDLHAQCILLVDREIASRCNIRYLIKKNKSRYLCGMISDIRVGVEIESIDDGKKFADYHTKTIRNMALEDLENSVWLYPRSSSEL